MTSLGPDDLQMMIPTMIVLSETDTTTTGDMLSRGPVRGQLFRKAKVKSLRMTALIVAAFIVCWTPYYVVFIIFTFFDPKQIDSKPYLWIFFFGMANSMVNPMIYGAFQICKPRRRYVYILNLSVLNVNVVVMPTNVLPKFMVVLVMIKIQN